MGKESEIIKSFNRPKADDKSLKEMVEQIKVIQKDIMKIAGHLAEMSAWIQTHIEIKDNRDKPNIFVEHIEKHFEEMGLPNECVMCKICNKTIDEIFDEEQES
jgi:hypothetical protein